MRIDILIIAAMAATAVAAPVVAQEAPAVQAKADPATELVCRRVEETGKLVKKKRKVCHTRAEWDRLAAMSRDAMSQGQMSGGSSGN